MHEAGPLTRKQRRIAAALGIYAERIAENVVQEGYRKVFRPARLPRALIACALRSMSNPEREDTARKIGAATGAVTSEMPPRGPLALAELALESLRQRA